MPDTKPPTIVCPSTLTACADVTVTDNADPSPTVLCLPFGTSHLKLVLATDASGNFAVRWCRITAGGMTHHNYTIKNSYVILSSSRSFAHRVQPDAMIYITHTFRSI